MAFHLDGSLQVPVLCISSLNSLLPHGPRNKGEEYCVYSESRQKPLPLFSESFTATLNGAFMGLKHSNSPQKVTLRPCSTESMWS